jgi:anthranilate synthase/aminodeoxychorismate synthase-like glutamine amidotransferase
MLLIIDNYDSFTHNVAMYLSELGAEVQIYRNDAIDLDGIIALRPSHLVISPGPCDPHKAGISLATIEHFAGHLPILGICLGHQAIGQVFGARVVRANQVMHGKISWVQHHNQGIFQGLQQPFQATRYHSLVLDPASLPKTLEVTAWTQDHQGNMEAIMGVRHRHMDIEGVQFHPESVLSEHGHQLFSNFLQLKAFS